tara:strand:+ start:1998 stop:2228 length:231 start_codon:yes stop_codon:yes gene_type:complete
MPLMATFPSGDPEWRRKQQSPQSVWVGGFWFSPLFRVKREEAAKLEMAGDAGLQAGLKEKAEEFKKGGSEIYVKEG